MLTTIEYQGKQVLAVIMQTESKESVLRMRDQLLEVLDAVSSSEESTRSMSAMTLYSILTLYKYFGENET